ncbi:MAG: undecaprenyl-diphosphatase [Candidatus Micrarchaeota archaeon]|nr:undecaprenyl-diphosphatase [Candidatus Micrarchaeota archaeon]
MTSLYQLLIGAIIGLVQGVAEWLPISSKTQVLIASNYLLGLSFQQAYTFGLFMEIGTVIAAVIYFRNELAALVSVLLGSRNEQSRKLFAFVVVSIIMTGLIGAPLYLIADSITGFSIGIPMLLIGAVLIADALLIRYSRKQANRANTRKLKNLRISDYIVVGIAQGIAALPGVSRSGITTSAMLLLNVEADEAFRLSFLTGIFASVAAFGLTLIATNVNVSVAVASIGLAGLGTAIIVSIIVSLFLIDFLIKTAGRSKIVYLTAALGIIAVASGLISLATGIGG